MTDGMAKEAVKKLQNAGCEVVQEFIEHEDLVNGALSEFDAVIVRSATKISDAKIIGYVFTSIEKIDAHRIGVVVRSSEFAVPSNKHRTALSEKKK